MFSSLNCRLFFRGTASPPPAIAAMKTSANPKTGECMRMSLPSFTADGAMPIPSIQESEQLIQPIYLRILKHGNSVEVVIFCLPRLEQRFTAFWRCGGQEPPIASCSCFFLSHRASLSRLGSSDFSLAGTLLESINSPRYRRTSASPAQPPLPLYKSPLPP